MAIKGNLKDLSLPTLVQMTCQEGQQARLTVQHGQARAELYFADGDITHAASGDQIGKEVVYHILTWEEGEFELEAGVASPTHTIETPWSVLLMEGLQRRDEELWDKKAKEKGRNNMPRRTITNVLEDLLKVPGLNAAVVISRDGFVIEAMGSFKALDLDALGASLAYAINGIQRMGDQLQISNFRDLTVEYEQAMIIARPVGDAVIALVAPDASQLGIIRYSIRRPVEELAAYL